MLCEGSLESPDVGAYPSADSHLSFQSKIANPTEICKYVVDHGLKTNAILT